MPDLTKQQLKKLKEALLARQRVLTAEVRSKREQAAEDIAEALSCAVVQIIGGMLVLFRPLPEEE